MKRPGIKVLFIGDPSLAHHIEGLGVFLPAPADAPQIANRAIEILTRHATKDQGSHAPATALPELPST